MNRLRQTLLMSAGLVGWLAGCDGKSAPIKPDSQTPAIAATTIDSSTPKTAGTETQPAPPKTDEDSAVAAVERTLKALETGNFAEAFEFLPPSYQSDVDGLIHEFAEQMDPELWARLNSTLRKGLQVFRTKKDFILAMDIFRDHPETEPVRKSWDSTLDLITKLAESESLNLNQLKVVKAKSLLAGFALTSPEHLETVGRAVGSDLSRQIAGVTVKPGRSNGAEQTIELRSPTDEKPTEIVYVKHDGRWLPKLLVEHWDSEVVADRDWLRKLLERLRGLKPALLEASTQADDVFERLLAASNREEFEQTAGPAILSLATEWPKLQRSIRQVVAGTTEPVHVTISIDRELTESEQTKLVATVLKPLIPLGSDYTLLSNDGRTFCRVLRVNDLPALQASLAAHFQLDGDAISYDHERSTIQIRLAP